MKRRPRTVSGEQRAAAAGPSSLDREAAAQAAAAAMSQPWAPSPIEYVYLDLLPGDARMRKALPWSGRRGTHARYQKEQALTVLVNDEWHDARVVGLPVAPKLTHAIELAGAEGKKVNVFLSHWNHAPREVETADFAAMRERYSKRLSAEHATIVDAVTGLQLDLGSVPLSIEPSRDEHNQPPPDAAQHWSDVSHLAGWLLDASRIRGKLASFAARLLEIGASYTPDKESLPADSAGWLSAELKASQQLFLESLPKPWDAAMTETFSRLLDKLAGLGARFDASLHELERSQLESRHGLEDMQRREAQKRINDEREAKVAFEIEQKEHREERDTRLKEAVLELPGEKRDEHLRVGREEIAVEHRNAAEEFQKKVELEEQQFVAEQKGQRMTVEISQRGERTAVQLAQRREPFTLMENELLAVLEDATSAPTSMLLTADPAAGKTSVLMQMLARVLQEEHSSAAVPIFIKVRFRLTAAARHGRRASRPSLRAEPSPVGSLHRCTGCRRSSC